MGKLPERWLPYSSVGQPIEGTKFIAFKVPLKDSICRNLKINERFTPCMLVEQCPRLSLVVDLTNTQRYYNPKEFVSKGIVYRKISCPGKVIPDEYLIQQFINIIDDYLKQSNDSEDPLIGVHCTHGLNRTAYFICNYMIRRLKIPAQEAISAFERARGHPIERQEYIRALIDPKVSNAPHRSEGNFESPLDSLYAERPSMNKYQNHRQRKQFRPDPGYFRRDQKRNWNRGPDDGHGRYKFPETAPYFNPRSGYKKHMDQVQPLNNGNRYGSGSRSNQFVDNHSEKPLHFSSLDPTSKSQGHSMSGYRKRPRDIHHKDSSGSYPQNHKQRTVINRRFIRVGEGLAASSSSEDPLRPQKSKANWKSQQNVVSSKTPLIHSQFDSPLNDSHISKIDSESR